MYNCYITFDIDMCADVNGKMLFFDDFEICFDKIKNVLERFPRIKTTWFVRIDNGMEKIFGASDYILKKYKKEVAWLRDNGHEIGWHIHSYDLSNDLWKQNVSDSSVLEEIKHLSTVVHKNGITDSVRIGGTYQSTAIMNLLNDLAFKYDSSALPRPMYPWMKGFTDWSTTPKYPYYPSKYDYRIPEPNHSLDILEVPITTKKIRAPYDSNDGVLRYVNVAYKEGIFNSVFNELEDNCVLIAHPSEIVKYPDNNIVDHPLISYSLKTFEQNLNMLNQKFDFATINCINK